MDTNPTREAPINISTPSEQSDKISPQSQKLARTISEEAQEAMFPGKNIYSDLPDFMMFDENKWLFVILNVLFTQGEFRDFVENTVFRRNSVRSSAGSFYSPSYFFRGLDYEILSRLLYGDISKIKEDKASNSENGVISLRLSDSIEPIKDTSFSPRNLKYNRSKESQTVSYFFDRRKESVDDETKPIYSNETKEIIGYRQKDQDIPFDADQMIAFFYVNDVKANLDYDEIKRPLDSAKPMGEGRIIAKTIFPQEWYESKIELSEEAHKNFGAKLVSSSGSEWGAKYNLREWEMGVIRVEAFKKFLVTEIPAKPGVPGLDINGDILKPSEVSLESKLPLVAGENVRIEERGWVRWLVATTDGFFRMDPKTGRVWIEEDIHITNIDGKETGGGITSGSENDNVKYKIWNDIGRHMRVPKMACWGDISGHANHREALMTLSEWVIATEGDILIWGGIFSGNQVISLHGDVIVGIDNPFIEMDKREEEKHSDTPKWEDAVQKKKERDKEWAFVTTSEISGQILGDTVVRAPQGTVSFIEAKWGVIIGKNVVGKKATNSLIIAEQVELEECEWCMVIFTKKASIKRMTGSPENDSSKLVYSSEPIWNSLQELEKFTLQLAQMREMLDILEKIPKISAKHKSREPLLEEDIVIIRKYQALDPKYKENSMRIRDYLKVKIEQILLQTALLSKKAEEWRDSGYSIGAISHTMVIHGDFSIETKENGIKESFVRKPFRGPRIRKSSDLTQIEKHYAAMQQSRNGYWEKRILSGEYERKQYKQEFGVEFKKV